MKEKKSKIKTDGHRKLVDNKQKKKICPVCWSVLEDGIVKNMCVNDDCPINNRG